MCFVDKAASGNSFQFLLSEDRGSCYSPFRQLLIQAIDFHGYVKTYLYLPAFLRLRNAAYLALLFSFFFSLFPFLSSSQRELRRHFLTSLWKLSFHFSLSFCLFTSLCILDNRHREVRIQLLPSYVKTGREGIPNFFSDLLLEREGIEIPFYG